MSDSESEENRDNHEDESVGEEEEEVEMNDIGDDGEEDDEEQEGASKKAKVHRLSLTETENFNEKLKKRGVVYIARIPPKMTPTKIKSLLSEFAEVTRVYLVEEDPTVRKRRRKETGNAGGKRYNEGWVEFSDKRKAKHIAQSLNTTPISMHKRNPHFGDLWNLKYLPKFKWSHLTEKVAYERRVREQKLRVEMMQARRETAAYVEMVETGKKLDMIEDRKRKRGEKEPVVAGASGTKKRHKQLKPMKEGADRSAKRALLGGLV